MTVAFMSPDHVATMNGLLEASAAVREACARLRRPISMVQRLDDGPGGQRVYYAMTFTDTVRFSLGDLPDADIVLVGDWGMMIAAARAAREGRTEDAGMSLERGEEALVEIGEIFALARTVATVPVDLTEGAVS